MRWQLSLAAEIFRRRDKPATEVHRPDAIDRHARRERIAPVNEPARKSETIFWQVRRERKNTFRRSWLDWLAPRIVSTTLQQKCLPTLRHFFHHHDVRDV